MPQIEPPKLDSPIDLTSLVPPAGNTLDSTEVTAEGIGDGGSERGWTNDDVPTGIAEMVPQRGPIDRLGPGRGPAVKGVPGIYGNRPVGGGGGRAIGIAGGSKTGDLAIGRALRWIARHQNNDGSWSLAGYQDQCKAKKCGGPGSVQSDAGATALGLLPFLAAGQTHLRMVGQDKASDYRRNVHMAVYWLLARQKSNGDLSAGSDQVMYSHGLATIALAELYALSHDKQVGGAAQRAVDFIVAAQHPESGGWRYKPGEPGDTSVTGWQIMALKSAQIAGLSVPSRVMERAHRWLKSTAQGQGGLFAYEPGGGATPTISAVGLLASQYLGAERDAPAMREGVRYLLGNLPLADNRNAYYWYYATQVLHNLPGSEWEEWNRRMRRVLVDSQVVEPGACS